MTPAQKSDLVKLVKAHLTPKPVTLAVGDGANDVSMLQVHTIHITVTRRLHLTSQPIQIHLLLLPSSSASNGFRRNSGVLCCWWHLCSRQAADCGVGIIGREGLKIVGASDYALGQFCFLRRLMFGHGRANYMRMRSVHTQTVRSECKRRVFVHIRDNVLVPSLCHRMGLAGWAVLPVKLEIPSDAPRSQSGTAPCSALHSHYHR